MRLAPIALRALSAFTLLIAPGLSSPARSAPAPDGADVFMAGGRSQVRRHFELADNRMILSVWINGQGPFRFILDSGAGNLMTVETARKLNLHLKKAGLQSGAGAGSIESWTTTVDSLNLGDLHLGKHTCFVMSLEPIRKAIGFEALDGVIGYEIFRQLAVEIDFQSGNVTFIRPEAFVPPDAGADMFPFELHGQVPVVDGLVEDLPGRFLIDTGDRSSLTLFKPFVDEHHLLDRANLTPEVVTGWGIGGPVPARVTRMDSLIVHRSKLKGVATRLSSLTTGAFAAADLAGSIGSGVLRRFKVTFDYPSSRMFLQPTIEAARRDCWDGAGAWLSLGDGGFEVRDVMKGGPAEEAGLRVGDTIVAVNNLSPALQPLLTVRGLLSDEWVGANISLRVRPASAEERTIVVVLRQII